MLRVVFDTVVFVRALINPHSYTGKLVFDSADRYQLVLSPPVVTEILEVLSRPALIRKFRALRQITPDETLRLFERAEIVEVGPIPSVSRDQKDDKFLSTAIAGGATYLVSADNDLLDLHEYQGIKIVNLEAFLQLLSEDEGIEA